MDPVEIIGAVLGVTSVWLSVRQNVWSWPTGIANVVLYFFVFYDAKLYADMGLQVVYAVLSVYGWYQWLYGGAGHTTLRVSRTPRTIGVILAGIAIGGAALVGTLLQRGTDASLPYLDSLLTSTSLVAQWMLTRKLLENWAVWIALDVVYVGMFLYKEMYPTAIQYAVFLGLATRGWIEWKRSLQVQPAAA
jgi:nicotinamide mononucleotide transporter